MSAPKAEAAGLTVERREELRRVAEAAGESSEGGWLVARGLREAVSRGGEVLERAEAAHIETFGPERVLALLDALAVAEATRDAYRDEYRATCDLLREANDAHDAMGAERDEARAAVERVRSELQLHDDWRYCPRCGRAPDWSGALSPGAPCMVCGRYPAALDTATSEAS